MSHTTRASHALWHCVYLLVDTLRHERLCARRSRRVRLWERLRRVRVVVVERRRRLRHEAANRWRRHSTAISRIADKRCRENAFENQRVDELLPPNTTRLSSGKSAAFQLDGLCGLRDCMGCQ